MHLYCHDHPETLTLETDVADARPGKIALAESPFYPGGGGQLADRGVVRWSGGEAKVIGLRGLAPASSGICSTRQSEVTGSGRGVGRSRLPPHDAPAAHRHAMC